MVSDELKRVCEGIVDGAVVLDAERRVLYFNGAYARFVGGSPKKLDRRVAEGARCYELTPLDVCASACVGCRAAEAGVALRVDGVGFPRRGDQGDQGEEVAELVVSATPLPGGLILESYRDVTAEARVQRRYREALRVERDQKLELERAVEERTRDLARANQELKRAQERLVQQEKMSSLGLLAAGIAHEINNPINFIVCNLPFLEQYIAALEKLADQLDAPPARAALAALKQELDYEYMRGDAPSLMKSIKNGAQRAAAIVADLRTFSRGGDGGDAQVDVVAGIEATLTLVKPLLKKATLERRLAPVPPVWGRAGELNQVFMNLITNAIQALPDGVGTVTVASRLDGDRVRVDVRDTGVGISEENLRRIFDPFFTTKPVGTGTGLGLSISYGIVERHGGELLVESKPGAGATFSVLLPTVERKP